MTSARAILPPLLLGAALGISGCGGCSGCKKTPKQTARTGVRPNTAGRAARIPRPPKPLPKNSDGSYSYGGLRFLEVVTGGAKANDKLPMVAALHGRGQSMEHFVTYFEDFTSPARLIVINGLKPSGKGYEWWDQEPPKDNPAVVPGAKVAIDKLATGIAAIAKVRPTVGTKVLVTGFSQGGGATFGLALRHTELVFTACEASGQLPTAMFDGMKKPAAPPEVHAFHGSADTTDPVDNSQRTVGLFKKIGYTIDLAVEPGVKHDFGNLKTGVFGCLKKALKTIRAAKQ